MIIPTADSKIRDEDIAPMRAVTLRFQQSLADELNVVVKEDNHKTFSVLVRKVLFEYLTLRGYYNKPQRSKLLEQTYER